MISDKLKKAFDKQIQMELESAHIYLGMSMYMADRGWNGAAQWLRKQGQEEVEHALAQIDYIQSRGALPELIQIPKPQQDFGTYLEVFEMAFKHECEVSASINNLTGLAIEEKDYATENFLRRFVDEQVEEEDTFSGHVDRLKLIKGDPAGLVVFDNNLAAER